MFKEKVLFSKEECEIIRNLNEGIPDIEWVYEKYANYTNSEITYMNSNLIKDIVLSKVKRLDKKIMTLPRHFNILKYVVGDAFIPHQDRGGEEGHQNKMTLVIQLSEGTYKGGILKILKDNPNLVEDKENNILHEASTEIGNTILFDAALWHEITPITQGERIALVAWFLKDDLTNSYMI
jgi:predicted 2-oxoglutarate/Fe(II)-dependent dioxygenase YbiX